MANFSFSILGQSVNCSSDDRPLLELVRTIWGELQESESGTDAWSYEIARRPDGTLRLALPDGNVRSCRTSGELIFELEEHLVIGLQTLRPQLAFVHSGAVVRNGLAYLVVAQSGRGKSTTVWGLLQHGCAYLSDELAPIDPATMQVFPYPRALTLKSNPPPPFDLPDRIAATEYTRHIPVAELPCCAEFRPHALGGILFVEYEASRSAPELLEIGAGEASARLYSCMLNQLAHVNAGLQVASEIASHVRCFHLRSADWNASCELAVSCF